MNRPARVLRAAMPLAAGVAAGLAAWKGRQLARQAAETVTGDWSDMLTAAQLEIGEDLERLLASREDRPRARKRLVERLTRRIDRYAFQAETAAYPALRRLDRPAGEALFAGLMEIRCAVDDLRLEPVTSRGWKARLRALAELLDRQATTEATTLVPTLHQLTADEYAGLTRRTAEAAVRLA